MQSYVLEKERAVPILARTEVLVVGSGPAGLSAAITAARAGADTMLTERYGCFGGAICHVGVGSVAWYRHEQTVEAGGLLREYEERLAERGGCTPEPQSVSLQFDVEAFKFLADEMVLEAGVHPLLHSYAVGTVVEDNRIRGVVFESKGGRFAVMARQVVDCTGDADIAFLSGAEYTLQDPQKRWPVTPIFNCKKVDTRKFGEYVHTVEKPTYAVWSKGWGHGENQACKNLFTPYIYGPIRQAEEEGLIAPDENVSLTGTYGALCDNGDVNQLNMVFLRGYEALDPMTLTKAELQGRRHILQAMQALKAYAPGFEQAELRNVGMTIGVRDSRRIVGLYRLSGEDVKNQARFEDSVGIFPEFIDGDRQLYIPTTGRYYQIPLGCLVSRNVENLFAAGRCISGDDTAHASFRNIGCCVVSGQGAGAAAAICAKQDKTARQICVKDVQQELERQKVRVF